MLLDDLGDHLINDRGRTVGSKPDDQRTRVLNAEVVPFFGEALSATLSEHDDRALLRYLIRANEALLRQARIEENVLPSRLACFGPQSDEVVNFAKGMVETTISAVSSRFLIEFLAGNPAVGHHQTTTEGYDRMLALASELTNKGFLSDAIYAETSSATVSVLPSRRRVDSAEAAGDLDCGIDAISTEVPAPAFLGIHPDGRLPLPLRLVACHPLALHIPAENIDSAAEFAVECGELEIETLT
jgi:hypothetical protein